jgi:DNA polymerase-3 subunit gamma/tau
MNCVPKTVRNRRTRGIKVSDEALKSIGRLANGGVRDSQSILDHMAAFCADKIEEVDILSTYGLATDSKLNEIIGAMRNGNCEKNLSLSDEVVGLNCDLHRLPCDLETRLHAQLSRLLSTSNENFPERK